jgi:hypothetical protein
MLGIKAACNALPDAYPIPSDTPCLEDLIEIVEVDPGDIPVTVIGSDPPIGFPIATVPEPAVTVGLSKTYELSKFVMLTLKPFAIEVDAPNIGVKDWPSGFALAVAE